MTATTLASVMVPADLSFRAASVAGAQVGGFAKIDNEFMKITQIVDPIVWVRARGDEGGTAGTHDVGASVAFGVGSEMPLVAAGELLVAPMEDRDQISVGSDQTLQWNTLRRDTTIILTKSSVGAFILEAPSAAADGVRLTITSRTSFAHVITATGLIEDGVTGGAKNTLTFAAFPGATVTLQAAGGKWTVIGKSAVT